ncbi:FecR family protein [Mariniphaga anaerophila]|nr:FecR domain-containing protein [Mariniphaga anaerophila]
MREELLIKFLNDECTEDELKDVIHWIKFDSYTDYSKEMGYGQWNNYDYESDAELPEERKLESLLDQIHHKINVKEHYKSEKSVALFTKWMTRVAAVLLLPVLALYIYTITSKPDTISQLEEFSVDSLEIVAPTGSKTFVQFSDGSEVYLNHGSKLKYPQKFAGETRGVVLSGEGYFKIAHNPQKPFVVKTRGVNVKAVGTTFNVYAYPDEKTIATTLVEGKVILEKKAPGITPSPIGSMVPGQHVEYNTENGNINSTIGDIEKYISWKDGKLIFKRDSIARIASRLSRWYSVDIDVADNDAREYTYTATFTDEPLWHILDLLKNAAPIEYEKVPRKRLPDGTYSKQKIIIWKRD